MKILNENSVCHEGNSSKAQGLPEQFSQVMEFPFTLNNYLHNLPLFNFSNYIM